MSSERDFLQVINDEKIVEYAGAIAFSAIIVVFGVFGNTLSVIFYGFKTRKTVTNSFIVALAVTDIITCIVLSDEIIELCFTVTFKSRFGCKLIYFSNHWLVFSSSLQLGLIAVDRYRRVCRPFGWQFSKFSAKVGIAVMFTVGFLASVRDWVILDIERVEITSPRHNITTTAYYCTHSSEKGGMQVAIKFFHLLDLLFLVGLIVCFIFMYGFIARTIWRARRNAKSHGFVNQKCAESKPESKSEIETSVVTNDFSQQGTESFSLSVTGSSEVAHNIIKVPDQTAAEKKERKPNKNYSTHGERKVAIMMMAITIGSMLSFVPYFIVNLTIKADPNRRSEQEFNVGIQIALRSYMLNNAMNPYVMCIFYKKYQHFVKRLFCRCWKQ